ncbi:S1 family peptidase [Streptomyces sp. NPDC001922]|uniref:S1 family peptidase n=1 Tax=Streptomyces sp. NPDC001922 TaxID=3364624 RepID=UPI0036AA5EAD
MSGRHPRTAWITGLLTAVAAGVLPAAPAHAVVGEDAKDGTYSFTAKLDIGGKRSCSGALVDDQWVLTAASCFADDPAQGFTIAAGAPKLKTTVTVGRTNLTASTGAVVEGVELVPRTDRDAVMVRLAKPVTGVAPVALASTALAQGEELRVAGYGRTRDAWVPDRLHTGTFTVDSTTGTTLGLSPKSPAEAAVCKGDTGGPALRIKDGRVELAGVNSLSWQGGCLGTDAAETRRGAVDARVDDLSDWMQQFTARDLLPKAKWANADLLATGYFTGGSAGGKRHMDLIVRWSDGSVTLYQGADHDNPKYPFSAEYKLAAAGSVWKHARTMSGGSFTGSGTDGLVVRWVDGELTEYTHVDAKGFHGEKTLRPAKSKAWESAKLVAVGRYTANALRDDLIVVWDSGKVSLYSDIDTNGVGKETELTKANSTWTHAEQISAGSFTGKGTNDLLVRWSDGEGTIYPGVDAAGFHGEIKIREPKSAWTKADVVTAGAFGANTVPNDIIVRWESGALSLYPGVDKAGTHAEVKLVP